MMATVQRTKPRHQAICSALRLRLYMLCGAGKKRGDLRTAQAVHGVWILANFIGEGAQGKCFFGRRDRRYH
jgi:hypothetical protein